MGDESGAQSGAEAVFAQEENESQGIAHEREELPFAEMLEAIAANDADTIRLLAEWLEERKEQLLQYALQEKHFQVAVQIRQSCTVMSDLRFAKLLYANGFELQSANYFLDALSDRTLDLEGYQRLGQILYSRGVYEEAASFFQYVLDQSPDQGAIRTALLLANLRQSQKLLQESLQLFPSSNYLREELKKLETTVERLEQASAFPASPSKSGASGS